MTEDAHSPFVQTDPIGRNGDQPIMRSTVAYSTEKVPVYVGYHCSKCGRVQAYKYVIKKTSSSSQKGVANRSERKSLGVAAQAWAEYEVERFAKEQQDALRKRDFRKAALPDHRCQYCKGKEPWMIPAYRTLKWIALICFIVAILLFMIVFGWSYQADESKLTLVIFSIATLAWLSAIFLFILRVVLRNISKRKTESTAASVDPYFMPLVRYNKEDFIIDGNIMLANGNSQDMMALVGVESD